MIENEKISLCETLNFTTHSGCAPERAIKIDPLKDINFYETLCQYCADNNIDLSGVSDQDFEGAVESMWSYGSANPQGYYFRID